MKQLRDARVLVEGESFKNSVQAWPKPCHVHQPTLHELKHTTFSDYVRHVVLKKAEQAYEHSDDEEIAHDDNHQRRTQQHVEHPTLSSVATQSQNRSASAASTSPNTPTSASAAAAAAAATVSPATSPSISASTTKPIQPRSDARTLSAKNRHSHNTRKRLHIPVDNTPLCQIVQAPATKYTQGMAKIRLLDGLWPKTGICNDQTARGPDWEEGTHLGSMIIPSPIKQCVRGIGGIYEYTFLDMPETTVAEFRTLADDYMCKQVSNHTKFTNYSDSDVRALERKFWKRLGPTMQPAVYGADMEGTLFGPHDCCGWNISNLESCLQLLLSDSQFHKGAAIRLDNSPPKTRGIPGVTTPYLYFGMWASVFCAHTEDMNLLSINYLHAGAPKVWYAVAPGEPSRRFEDFCALHFHESKTSCDQYLRHKRCLLSPHVLKKAGIPFHRMVQYPGDAMITFPGGYHFGFNAGFNVAEATNFAVPEWVPYGRLAGVCLCRPDSVRIDMNKFSRILIEYDEDQRDEDKDDKSWLEWAYSIVRKTAAAKRCRRPEQPAAAVSEPGQTPSKQQIRKEFWIEVMPPPAVVKKLTRGKKRKMTKMAEVWHLAKPLPRKAVRPSTRVLCILSMEIPVGGVDGSLGNTALRGSVFAEDEVEQCFAGCITEVNSGHVRVHLDGFQKKDDIWMESSSPKLHLDGGRWSKAAEANQKLPKLHYWKEEDSKRRCV